MVLVSYKPCSIYRTLQTNRPSFLGLQSSDDSSTLGGVTSLRGEESRMMTVEFITALFYEVDEQLGAIPKHPEAHLWPSEVVTLGLLHALKGVGNRAFYRWLMRQCEDQMIVLSDTGFHAVEGDPSNLKLCPRGEWQDRMLVETVLSMLTLVCHLKKVMHRGWAYFQARLAFTMAAFNVLVQWHGFQPNASGFVPLSIAEFSL